MILAFKDGDFEVQWGAAQALGEIGKPAVEPLIKALKDGNSSIRTRVSAAYALGMINDTRVVESLIQALKDRNSNVRYWAAEALGELKDCQAIEPLTLALKDSDKNVREEAAKSLGKIRKPAVPQTVNP